jgi:SAM-dependent methyltransferase
MLEVRVNEPEFLDAADCNPQLASGSYMFMRLVNRFAGGTKAVKNFLAREISKCDRSRIIRVLDIGSGTCDIPLAITEWARKKSLKIEFTCIETNETAIKIAEQNIRQSGNDSIVLKNENFLEFESRQHFDYAIGSMFFHHFQDDQILQIIEKLRTCVTRSVLINDLRRNSINYLSCFLFVCFLPGRVRHDALLSVRKGFKSNELHRLLSRMENVQVSVENLNFSRLTAIIRFNRGVG